MAQRLISTIELICQCRRQIFLLGCGGWNGGSIWIYLGQVTGFAAFKFQRMNKILLIPWSQKSFGTLPRCCKIIMKLATFPVKWPRKIPISKVSACSQVDQPANPDLLPAGKKADCNRSYNASYPIGNTSSERESENRKQKVSKRLLPSGWLPFFPIYLAYTGTVK